MGEVVTVARWGQKTNRNDVIEKFSSCDKFIRSKIIPPPLGSVVFSFKGGKVAITGDTTTITGDDCEVVIRGNYVCINGCYDQAANMFCSIHREIEEIASATNIDPIQVFLQPTLQARPA